MTKPSTAPADRDPNDHRSVWRVLLIRLIGRDVDTAYKGDRRYIRAVDDLFWGSGSIAAYKLMHFVNDNLAEAVEEANEKERVRIGKIVVLYYASGQRDCGGHDSARRPPRVPWCWLCCLNSKHDINIPDAYLAVANSPSGRFPAEVAR